jgi:hypothetical protein
MNSELSLSYFLSSELIFKINRPTHRMDTEKRSMQKLMKSDDFLSQYNLAIRYVFLTFLERGYDVRPNKVHLCFREYCIQVLELEKEKVLSIVKARHERKYFGNRATECVECDLSRIIELLRGQVTINV